MLPENFSLGRVFNAVTTKLPSFRFRDKDLLVHNAGDAAKCRRQEAYKKFGYPESNPTDMLGQLRMRFGSWLERGLIYEMLGKAAPFGIFQLASQGDCGEHGTFYGTSWHGYRDIDIGLRTIDGKIKPIVVEVKSKVGFGAAATLKKTPYSKELVKPKPDTEWGYSQQLSLYLRNAYMKTKDNPMFNAPIVDGILFQLLYADGIGCFVEYFFEYLPEEDVTHCYYVHCEEHPECCGPLDIKISLRAIAQRWSEADKYLSEGTLPPPDFQRKYLITDERVEFATKTDLDKAVKNVALIGDVQCKYCSYRDKCAQDLGIDLTYAPEEVKALKSFLKNR